MEDKLDFLKNYQLFNKVSQTNLNSLSYAMVDLHYYKDQDVYREALDVNECIYLVKSGEFSCTKLIKKDPDGQPRAAPSFKVDDISKLKLN